MSPAVSRALRWTLTAAIVAFLILFARTIDWAAAWQSIRSASLPLLLAALAVNFSTVVIKGVRWWLFLKPAGAPSLPLAVRATIAGAGLNNVLVANGGDAARVVFVSQSTALPSSTVLATLALERLFDPVGFVVLLVYGVVAFSLPPALERWRLPAELALVVIAGLLVWFVFASRKAKPDSVITETPPASGIWGRLRRFLSGFASSARLLASGPRFLGALGVSMLAWVGQIYTFQLAAAAAHVSIPAAGSLAALLAINLGLLIRATPGNVGFFQFVFALATEPFGVARNDAIAVSLLIQTLQIIPVTLIGVALAPEFIFKRRGGKREIPQGSS
ncbi:MAG TPA: lysylphosphatidylglycerol synthase transmembrane domain-containing protein [Gemmatimonadaceae bacterium]|nr:lysylphosphatidylglycerol synthase transmembrane domain-containing protein [Gemmatimonadaceae bacterium]